ncbi:MAG: type II secretion system protein [Synergistaceae bacterium]|jgi:prepilin-type N-terminal cleavage/methylation domain-containing protein|nr:type II secretion system protein [Synergistaceae bacterium]
MKRNWRSGRKGFTLLEVLVAVSILGLAGAGALRLVYLSEKALDEARQERMFTEEVSRLRLDLLYKRVPENGTSGDLSWETRPASRPFLDNRWTLRYRVVSVKSKNRFMELILP